MCSSFKLSSVGSHGAVELVEKQASEPRADISLRQASYLPWACSSMSLRPVSMGRAWGGVWHNGSAACFEEALFWGTLSLCLSPALFCPSQKTEIGSKPVPCSSKPTPPIPMPFRWCFITSLTPLLSLSGNSFFFAYNCSFTWFVPLSLL